MLQLSDKECVIRSSQRLFLPISVPLPSKRTASGNKTVSTEQCQSDWDSLLNVVWPTVPFWFCELARINKCQPIIYRPHVTISWSYYSLLCVCLTVMFY